MVDITGRKIEVGQWVLFTGSDRGARMRLGKTLEVGRKLKLASEGPWSNKTNPYTTTSSLQPGSVESRVFILDDICESLADRAGVVDEAWIQAKP